MVRAVPVPRVTGKLKQICASLIQLSAWLHSGAPSDGRDTRPWAWVRSLGAARTLGGSWGIAADTGVNGNVTA